METEMEGMGVILYTIYWAMLFGFVDFGTDGSYIYCAGIGQAKLEGCLVLCEYCVVVTYILDLAHYAAEV